MVASEETLWPIPRHTLAKHHILRRYLGAWFGIMGCTQGRIVYLDGFCGPGRYAEGEEGSPILALNLALNHRAFPNFREITFLFIEKDEARIEYLKQEISQLRPPSKFHVSVHHNQFEGTLTGILDDLQSKGSQMAPTFAFIDPFGFKGAPYKLTERLLGNSKTEVFINIMVDSVNRWLEHPNEATKQHIVDLFGTEEVLDIIDSDGDRVTELRKLYQRQLEKIADYVRYFEMRDEYGRTIYFLFFASNNPLGHVKMKEAFWSVDRESGYQFSDATNPDQLVLFELDPSLNLANELIGKYAGKTCYTESIRRYIEDETPYVATHMKRALCHLEFQRKITPDPLKIDGKKRRKGSFPDGVIVRFS
jgi:three-Cys-motif partner protein